MTTRIIKILPHWPEDGLNYCDYKFTISDDVFIDEASAVIRAGGLVAFPTETVYGLGADAFNADAVAKIYEVKGRPADNPLIIHISHIEQLAVLIAGTDGRVMKLARRFWPGPLTMVIKKWPGLPDFMSAGLDTIAVRMPAHPVALALIKAAGTPVAAPSANLSGKPSPTGGAHVINDLSGKIDMIIDSGRVAIGLESTVLDVSCAPAVILRPGGVTRDAISAAIGRDNLAPYGAQTLRGEDRPASPGTKYRHYAPDAPMLMFKGSQDRVASWIKLYAQSAPPDGAATAILASDRVLSMLGADLLTGKIVKSLGGSDRPGDAALGFYSALRAFDEKGAGRIYCEAVNADGIGEALTDRMTRASGANTVDADDPLVLFVCTGNTCRSAMAEALFDAESDRLEREIANRPVSITHIASAGREPSGAAPRAISAGLYAPDGAMATFEAIDALRRYGIDLSMHRAHPLDHGLISQANLVLAMTGAHRDEIVRRYPGVSARVFTFDGFIKSILGNFGSTPDTQKWIAASAAGPREVGSGDIDDPFGYGPEIYEKCAGRLYAMASLLASRLILG